MGKRAKPEEIIAKLATCKRPSRHPRDEGLVERVKRISPALKRLGIVGQSQV